MSDHMPLSFGQNRQGVERRFRDYVNAERMRRMEEGTDVRVPEYGWVAVQGRPEDQQSLATLAQTAGLVAMSDANRTFDFMDRNNTLHRLTAAQVMALFLLASTYVQDIYQASFRLKAGDIFQDPTRDDHWPTPTIMPKQEA